MFRRTVLTVVFALSLPLPARAECFTLTARYAMSEKRVDLVFRGRVTEVAQTSKVGYRATFQVERVWKGSVPDRLNVHVWLTSPDAPRYEKGQEYVALVGRLGLGLGGTNGQAYFALGCSDQLAPTFEQDLGEGYAPLEIVKKDKNQPPSDLGSRFTRNITSHPSTGRSM